MTNKTGQPSAKAHIDDLQAWASGKAHSAAAAAAASKANKASARDASVLSSEAAPIVVHDGAVSGQVERRRGVGSFLAGTRSTEDTAPADAKPPMPFPIKVLIGLGVAVGAYVIFSLLISVVMVVLMALGVAAAVYVAYRIGRWQGRRDAQGQ